MKPLRLGLTGFGRLASDYYLPALRRIAGASLVAVAEPLAERRARAQARLPRAAVVEGLQELLDGAAIDALLVASPPSSHFAAWRAASAAGIPAFVEKPLLLAEELPLVAGGEDESPVMVDFNRRFWPAYARARELVRAGALGAPIELDFLLHLDVLGWSTVTRHRLDPAEGGLAHDLASHALDLAAWIVGEEPQEIAAEDARATGPGHVLLLALRFAGGSRARLDLAYGDRTRERLRVRGPLGRLRLDEPNLALHLELVGRPRSPAGALLRDLSLLGYRALRRSRSFGRASVHAALTCFVDCVRTGAPLSPGESDGLRNARWIDAALRSAAAVSD